MPIEHRGAPPTVDPTAYGLPRDATPLERMSRQSAWFGAHADDEIL